MLWEQAVIRAFNALLQAVLGNDPQPEKKILYREDAKPGEWNRCSNTRPLDGETVIVATRETHPEPWGKAMKAFGVNCWMLIARSSNKPGGEPVWWRYE